MVKLTITGTVVGTAVHISVINGIKLLVSIEHCANGVLCYPAFHGASGDLMSLVNFNGPGCIEGFSTANVIVGLC